MRGQLRISVLVYQDDNVLEANTAGKAPRATSRPKLTVTSPSDLQVADVTFIAGNTLTVTATDGGQQRA